MSVTASFKPLRLVWFPAPGCDIFRLVAQTKSRLLAVSLEDVLGVLDQPNIPGTVNEHPNWRRRLPVSIDQMASAVDIAALKSATRERSRAEL